MNTDSTEPTIPTIPTPTIPTTPIKESLETVMRDLEQKVNPKSTEEGFKLLVNAVQHNDVSTLLDPMQAGAKEFEDRVGRPMTYGEMRAMWG